MLRDWSQAIVHMHEQGVGEETKRAAVEASRAFALKQGWYWWGFGVHQAYRGLSAACVTATGSFGTSCVHFSGPAS